MARNVWLILTYTFFGPAIGAVVALVLITVIDHFLSAPDASGFYRVMNDWPFILSVGYAFGLVPAFASALVQIVATRFLPTRRSRLIAAPLIGAAVSTASISLFLALSEMSIGFDFWILLLLAGPGALAAFVSLALVELFHPLPRPA